MTQHDAVNHPKHYTSHPSGVECIQITRHMSFNLGNVIKYLWRADEKGAPLEDLKKARWYLDDEIKRREADAALCQDEGCPHHGTPHVCVKPAPNADADGWIEWHGGVCPVAPDTLVQVRLRGVVPITSTAAKFLSWRHTQRASDIVAYRVVQS